MESTATNEQQLVYPIVFGLNPAGYDEVPQILEYSKAGLYSFQFPDNHINGQPTPDNTLPGARRVGIPCLRVEPGYAAGKTVNK